MRLLGYLTIKHLGTNSLLLLPLLLFLLTSCSGVINEVRVRELREETLLKAGFKPVPLTEVQEEHLQSLHQLHAGKITTIQREGKIYFIYPDFSHHRLLVGRNRQFMHYNELTADELTPFYKKRKVEELDWVESGLWDNIGGWD